MSMEEVSLSKMEILDTILNRLKTWDLDLESGIKIIQENEIDIKKIQDCKRNISGKPSEIELGEDYKQKIDELNSIMIKFMEQMGKNKQILLEEMNMNSRNNDIITSYISSDFKAAFIDKNV